MKRVAEFTPHQLETRDAVLGCFDVKHVNRAVIEFGMSDDPFPDIGKLASKFREYRKTASEYADGHGVKPPQIIQDVAEALRRDVEV